MKKLIIYALLTVTGMSIESSAKDEMSAEPDVVIKPIEHASLLIQAGPTTIYIDPVGDAKRLAKLPKPDIILITHIHRDHLDPALIAAIKTDKTTVLAPQSVLDQLKHGKLIANGQTLKVGGVSITAIPAYNTTKDRLLYHPKARGDNGYVIGIASQRIYISGDTEDIKEMRGLKNIDHAVICMNLPYTMTEEQAASAVMEMKPKIVTPYHYRGKSGISNLKTFTRLVGSDNKDTRIQLMDWYPGHKTSAKH